LSQLFEGKWIGFVGGFVDFPKKFLRTLREKALGLWPFYRLRKNLNFKLEFPDHAEKRRFKSNHPHIQQHSGNFSGEHSMVMMRQNASSNLESN
jgi:hypothetical protein